MPTEATSPTMPAHLTPETITALLGGQRERGGYKRIISSFFEGGELAMVVTDLPLYKEKNRQGVLNSLNSNIKEHGFLDKVQAIQDKENNRVLLVNKVQYAAAMAAASDDEE